MDSPPLHPTASETSALLSSPLPLPAEHPAEHLPSSETLSPLPVTNESDLKPVPSPTSPALLPSPLASSTSTTPTIHAPTHNTSPFSSPSPISSPREGIGLLDFSLTGRHAYAAAGYLPAAGQVLIETTAKHPTVLAGLLRTHCSGCLKTEEQLEMEKQPGDERPGSKLLDCSGCHILYYCSTRCYAKNAEAHFEECRDLQRARWTSGIPASIVRLICKILRARSRGEYHDQPLLYSLTPLSEEANRTMRHLAEQVQRFLRPKPGGLTYYGIKDYEHLLEMVYRVSTCTFMLYDHEARPVGLGISPIISRVSHSCMANAALVFPLGPTAEGGMRVISRELLRAGEEVSISYIDDGIPFSQRGSFLTQFGFPHKVDCALCSTEKLDIRWAGRHVGCENTGLVPIYEGGLNEEDPIMPHTAKCSGCSAVVPCMEINSSGYNEAISALEHIRMKEEEGLTGPMDGTEELARLQTHIEHILQRFPSSIYPLPPLLHCLGRLLAKDCPSTNAALAGRNYLYQAWEGLLSAHNQQASPEALWILIPLVGCYIYLSRSYIDKVDQLSSESDGSEAFVEPIRKNLQDATQQLTEARKSVTWLENNTAALGLAESWTYERVKELAMEVTALMKRRDEYALEFDRRGE